MNNPVLLLCLLLFSIHVASTLECSLKKHLQNENVRDAIQKCIVNSTVVTVEKSDDDSNNFTSSTVTPIVTDQNKQNLTKNTNSTDKKVSKRSDNSGAQESQNQDEKTGDNDETDSSKCSIYCILRSLELLDSQGYPDHHLIAETLMRYTNLKEVKDFFQDSTDECFQLQYQDHLQRCQYASTLMSCLAEKGRLNCGDWTYYSLSFE